MINVEDHCREDRTGEASPITFISASNCGHRHEQGRHRSRNISATSLVIEKVVSEPRVIRELLADRHHLDEFGRSLSRTTMLPACARPAFDCIGDADVGSESEGGCRWCRRRTWRSAARNSEFGTDVVKFVLRRRLGDEVVDAGLRGDRRGGYRDCRRSP